MEELKALVFMLVGVAGVCVVTALIKDWKEEGK